MAFPFSEKFFYDIRNNALSPAWRVWMMNIRDSPTLLVYGPPVVGRDRSNTQIRPVYPDGIFIVVHICHCYFILLRRCSMRNGITGRRIFLLHVAGHR
jgi:hypothetical protein